MSRESTPTPIVRRLADPAWTPKLEVHFGNFSHVKREVDTLDVTPNKKVFLAIIADYSLLPGVCELVDNAVDAWNKGPKSVPLRVTIDIDAQQSKIVISDNAGGVPPENLRFIVGPGLTSNNDDDDTIGSFGVGSKRAVVALARDVQITTRYGKGKTHQVEFGEEWLQDPQWELPYYEVDEIAANTTTVTLRDLREQASEEQIAKLREHLQFTYARFIKAANVEIVLTNVSSDPLTPLEFDNWAYPKQYPPQEYVGQLKLPKERNGLVEYSITAGLSRQASAIGEFGVTLYCNDRMVFRNKTDFTTGFGVGLAGSPHVTISLAHTIIDLRGPARLMPWNSTKSDFNTSHPAYTELREQLFETVKHYASLSRRLRGTWRETVRPYTKGRIKQVRIEATTSRKQYLPPLPADRGNYDNKVVRDNAAIARKKPWVRGLEDSMIAAEVIHRKHKLSQRNRVAFIVLDSTLEIAFKEFLLNECELNVRPHDMAEMFRSQGRRGVLKALEGQGVKLSQTDRRAHDYFYAIRNKLVHEKVSAPIEDGIVRDYQTFVAKLLKRMFGLEFGAITR